MSMLRGRAKSKYLRSAFSQGNSGVKPKPPKGAKVYHSFGEMIKGHEMKEMKPLPKPQTVEERAKEWAGTRDIMTDGHGPTGFRIQGYTQGATQDPAVLGLVEALEMIEKQTENTPLITDGGIVAARTALAKWKGEK